MSIDAVKNISLNTFSSKNKTSFTSTPEVQTSENKNGKTLLIAGLVALGAVGVYIATRGKKGGSKITEEIQRPAEQIKDMTIDAFKQNGNKFEKGIAKLANGENYTGKLTHQLKDGSVVTREYVDGLLKKYTKTNNNGELIADFKKEIDAEKGVIVRTYRTLDKEYNFVQDITTGKMLQAKGKRFYYTKDGLLRATKDENKFLTVYHTNGKPRLVQDHNGAKFYDENGNLACEINTNFSTGAESYFAKYPDRKVKYELSSDNGLSKKMSFYAPDSSRPNVRLSKFMKDGKWYPSATVSNGGNRYDIDIADENWDIFNATKNIAKYNPKTGDIDILDSSVTEDTVQNVIEQIKKAASSVKQEYKTARQMIREYQDTNSLISRNYTGNWHEASFIF